MTEEIIDALPVYRLKLSLPTILEIAVATVAIGYLGHYGLNAAGRAERAIRKKVNKILKDHPYIPKK